MAKYSSRPKIRVQVYKIKKAGKKDVKDLTPEQKFLLQEGLFVRSYNRVLVNLNLYGGKERTGQESFS